MKYIVVRDASGKLMASGEDNGMFEPIVPAGCVRTIEDAMPPPNPLTYQQLRAAAYPPTTDYLDGVVKGNQVQIDKYIADCLAIKAKYPK